MESSVDVRVPCPGVDLVFKRSYSSADGPWCELALGWSHSYSFAVGWASSNKVCVVRSADPSVEGYAAPVTFPLPAKGGMSCAEGGPYRLFRNGDETLRFLTPDGLSYNFDPTGRLVSVVHISGATVSLSRDGHGRLVRAEHSNGKALSFGYSPAGRLTSVSTPDSDFTVRYHYRSVDAPAAGRSYDLLEKVETVFHGRVDTARYAYFPDPPPGKTGVSAPPGIASRVGAGARLGGVSATAGGVAAYRLSEKTDENGYHAFYDYVRPNDSASAKCGALFAEGGWFEASLKYEAGRTTAVKPIAAGNVTLNLEYDSLNRETLRSMGTESFRTSYDGQGNISCQSLTNSANGAHAGIAFEYGNFNNVTNVLRSFNGRSRGRYEVAWDAGWNLPRRMVSPLGRVREWTTNGNEFAFHPAGVGNQVGKIRAVCSGDWHPLEVFDADGVRTVVSYDASNYVSRVAMEGMPAVDYAHDALGRVASRCVPGPDGGRVTSYERNRRGRPTHIIYPDGTSERFTYNGDGTRVSEHMDALGRKDVYEWIIGEPVHAGRVVDGTTNLLWTVDYDPQLNVVAVKDPLGRAAESYVLDANERVVAATNLEGQVATVTYLMGGLVSSRTRFDGTSVSYSYDAGGDVERIDYPDATLAFTHDADGLLTSASNSAGVVSNEYDSATGWLISSRGIDGSDVSYGYHLGGGVASMASPAGVVSNTLDAAGRKSVLFTLAGNIGFGYCPWNGRLAVVTNVNGTTTSYAYDVMDRVTNITWSTAGGSRLGGFSYVYDAIGRIVSRSHDLGTNVFNRTYTYDDFDRLVSDGDVSYTYDAAGNRMTKNGDVEGDVSYALGVGDRLASWSGGSYTYDDAGCVTRIERVGKPTLDLAWNGQYQLVSVATNGVFAEGYAYDALGRRVATTTQQGTIRHIYDNNWQCIADMDVNGNVLCSYVWGDGIDNLLAVRIGDETYTALTDIQGTVWGFTDGNGEVVARWTYDAWGNVLASNVSVPALVSLRCRFQGREWSAVTGLMNFRMRWYDTGTGRWLSKDPIGLNGGIDLYVFCDNSPLNFMDMLGCEKDKSRPYWERYFELTEELIIDPRYIYPIIPIGIMPKRFVIRTGGRGPALGSGNQWTSIPRAFDFGGDGLRSSLRSSTFRGVSGMAGAAVLGVGVWNAGVMAGALIGAVFME